MTLDLNALRAMRKNSTGTLAKITKALEKDEQGGFKRGDDERFWKAQTDKAGNASAIIRFLPAREDDEMPWSKVYSKGFQGPAGKWYIENCLTTIGQPDPVVEYSTALWNGTEEDKEKARKLKRRLSYYANVLIIKDPANPDNEGQVKVFKFGKKLFDKIKDKLQPTFEDEKPHDVFDPFEGANFRLRIRKVDGYSNTDKSEFDSASELCGGDEAEMLSVLNKRHRLGEFTDPASFKTYEELAKKFDLVMNGGAGSSSLKKAADFLLEDEEPKVKEAPVAAKVKEEPKKKEVVKDDEDDLSFFTDLINDD
ncbi:MAG: single-stranded DNA-binding protein [Desulfuromonadaceae bacterium]